MVKKVLTDIHSYWFGELRAPGDIPKEQMELWFTVKPETDAHIRDTYGKYLEAAKSTEWDLANLSRMEQVGLVVLLDQFPRNMFRGTSRAFAADPLALDAARHVLAQGYDRGYLPVERLFAYLPFEHSEALEDQLRACELMQPLEQFPETAGVYRYALAHRDIIQRFGRFPHRNAALGRTTTPEEQAFLDSGGFAG